MSLSYTMQGQGKIPVIVVHDWSSDCQSYAALEPYLMQDATYCFVDLRGYGGSKTIAGAFTLQEAAEDIIDVAKRQGWARFHFVGHSMSGMLGLYMAAMYSDVVSSVVALSPVAPCGMPDMDEEIFGFLQTVAAGSVDSAKQAIDMMSGGRYDQTWAAKKVEHWYRCSVPEARAGYLKMFVGSNFKDKAKKVDLPVLIMCGEYDLPTHQKPYLQEQMADGYPGAEFLTLKECAHYPMQEIPAMLATCLNRWISKVA